MKQFSLGALAIVLGLSVVGCQTESEPGGPGATSQTTNGDSSANGGTAANGSANGHSDGANSDRTFTISVPSTSVGLKPGESEEVTINLNRGDEFKQSVTLEFILPAGITAGEESVVLGPEQDEAKITLTAGPTAAPGKHTIQVKATPETGAPTSHMIEVEIESEGDSNTGARPAPPRDADTPEESVTPPGGATPQSPAPAEPTQPQTDPNQTETVPPTTP